MVIVGGPEARIEIAEGVLERVVPHRRAHVEEGLHGGSVPVHLLHFVHALGHDLVNCAFRERGRDRLIASTPGSVVRQSVLVALKVAQQLAFVCC